MSPIFDRNRERNLDFDMEGKAADEAGHSGHMQTVCHKRGFSDFSSPSIFELIFVLAHQLYSLFDIHMFLVPEF